MKSGRRNFLKTTALYTAGGFILPPLNYTNMKGVLPGKGLKLSFEPYELNLKHVFTLAGSSRSTTPVMLTRIELDGITGYGEASMPPYLGESQKTAARFLSALNLKQFADPFRMDEILEYVDEAAPGNTAAKASVDIALHDLTGKLMGQPWHKIWGFSAEATPDTSFTIGIDKPEVVRQKVKEANPYKILKVKLGGENDRKMIETIRSVTDKPLCVDVNQGWTIKEEALEMIQWLSEKGVVFIEQPMPKEMVDAHAWLTEHSPLPIIGDEAIQRLADIHEAAGVYSGINIKWNTMMVFMLTGVLSAVAGIIYTARVGSAAADAGRNLELDAIAACVIGGTSLMGGRGSVPGALLGALIMASIDNGMSMMNIEDFYQNIIKGTVLVLAVYLDVASKKK